MKSPRRLRLFRAVLGALLTVSSAMGGNPSLDALEAIASRAASLDDFLARPDLVRAYGRALEEYYGRNHFRCESYEAILDQLRALKDKVPGLKERLWQRETFPSLAFTASDGESSAPEAVYDLHSVPRRFHGLWNDPSRQGCLSKDCREADPTSPMRWAVALEGSRVYLVERRGQFVDASLLVLPSKLGKDTVGLVVLSGSPLLRRRALYRATSSAEPRTVSLLDLWAESVGPSLGYKAIVERRSADTRDLTLVPLFPQGAKPAGDAMALEPLDALAAPLAAALPERCYGSKKKNARDLLTGLPFPSEQTTVSTWSTSGNPSAAEAQKARDLLLQFEYPTLGKLGVLADTNPDGVQILLTNALRDPDAGIRSRAALAIRALDAIDVARHEGAASQFPEFRLSGEGLHEALHRGLTDPDPEARGLAALALSGREKPGQGAGDLVTPMKNALSPTSLAFVWPPETSSSPTVPPSDSSAAPGGTSAAKAAKTDDAVANPSPQNSASSREPASPGAVPPGDGGPSPSRPKNAMDVIEALGRELETRNVPLSRPTLETLMDQVADMRDPRERGKAEVKLAELVLRNPDPGASMHAVEAGLEKHPKDLSLFPVALSESGAKQCPSPKGDQK